MYFSILDRDLLSIQEARILAENAREAQLKLAGFTQEQLDLIVEAMAKSISSHTSELARMSCEETDYGNWQDKYIKDRFACEYLPASLRGMRCVGIISSDPEKKMMDIGVPVGVIVSLCPATSPVSTAIHNALIGIKAGNAIIFSPHPRARNTIGAALDILIEAAEENGLPEGCLSYLHNVTKAGTEELMRHEAVSMILDTGVPAMLDIAYDSQKPVIYGGTGNGPAFIERTADIHQAVIDIIASKTFDNGVASAAEQSIVVDGPIDAQVQAELRANGGYFMTEEEADALGKMFYYPNGKANPELAGKTAKTLAKWAGFTVPDDTKVLIAKQDYVSVKNPYSREKLCPVLAYYVEDDWRDACVKCIELILTERHGHTMVIHSKDQDVIAQFALKKPVARMLVNTPAVFGSLGATTNLFPAMTLGSATVGEGVTSENVSPMNLIYVRKVGYGVRRIGDIGLGQPQTEKENTAGGANMEVLQQLLLEAIRSLDK